VSNGKSCEGGNHPDSGDVMPLTGETAKAPRSGNSSIRRRPPPSARAGAILIDAQYATGLRGSESPANESPMALDKQAANQFDKSAAG
jgi:hypothetical protein